jgi:hypothetical protein
VPLTNISVNPESDLLFIAIVALKDLGVKLPFSVSRYLQVFNAPCGSHQIAGVRPIAIATTIGSAFAPGGSDTLLQFFPHDLFDQDLDRAYGKTT